MRAMPGLLVLPVLLAACGDGSDERRDDGTRTPSEEQVHGPPTISSEPWDVAPDGQEVARFTLQNENGMTVRVLDWGGIVTQLLVPDRDGALADVVLGYDSIQAYVDGRAYFGAIVGRYANRIAGGRFELEPPAGDPIRVASHDRPEIGPAVHVRLDRIVPENDVGQCTVAVGHEQLRDDAAPVEHPDRHAVLVLQGEPRDLLPVRGHVPGLAADRRRSVHLFLARRSRPVVPSLVRPVATGGEQDRQDEQSRHRSHHPLRCWRSAVGRPKRARRPRSRQRERPRSAAYGICTRSRLPFTVVSATAVPPLPSVPCHSPGDVSVSG